jgi:flagellar biosynthetic protein FliQ
MGSDEAIEMLRQMMWRAAEVSAPVLLAALAVGVLVSVLQVATQLQEMTLSYIPKLFVTALVLITVGPWMLRGVTQFAEYAIRLLPSLG